MGALAPDLAFAHAGMSIVINGEQTLVEEFISIPIPTANMLIARTPRADS
jgi:hypothetical protein